MNLVDKKQIMKMLNISKGKLDHKIKNDKIDYVRMGRVIRFEEDKVIESIKNNYCWTFSQEILQCIQRKYIEGMFNKFNIVRSILFFNGDMQQIMDGYLHYDKLIIKFNNNIQQIKNNIANCQKQKFEILNKSVLQLKSENKLGSWMNESTDSDLNEIKNILDVEKEYKLIIDYRFNKAREERGKVHITY